ncbi:MAG: phosphoribosylformimino-5-aminoimidazole carboxamide ribotide isomerase [Caballeronia sp.]|nr:phosphoribosylformimino-5-aminoimidazole carboxamide ribotide isomerase [Caballeronia sp.]
MLLIPAIDLKDGQCVRLKQGDMDQATIFSEDPAAMAGYGSIGAHDGFISST